MAFTVPRAGRPRVTARQHAGDGLLGLRYVFVDVVREHGPDDRIPKKDPQFAVPEELSLENCVASRGSLRLGVTQFSEAVHVVDLTIPKEVQREIAHKFPFAESGLLPEKVPAVRNLDPVEEHHRVS